jgi:ubiquinone biosynthesis protein UbiJ
MLEAFAVPAINRLLAANPWSLEKLRPHAGKTALLSSPPLQFKLTVTDAGTVSASPRHVVPDATIVLTPGSLLTLAARDEQAWSAAQVTGDVEFAGAIDYVRRNIAWDYEETLSRVLGDIGAHRVGRAVRELDRWGRAAVVNLGQAITEYATDEQRIVTSARAVDEWNREVDDVRDGVSRLEKRIEAVARRMSAKAPGLS